MNLYIFLNVICCIVLIICFIFSFFKLDNVVGFVLDKSLLFSEFFVQIKFSFELFFMFDFIQRDVGFIEFMDIS